MVKVAVIIPVYNVEKYLPQCLDSVINQTLSDIEIICVNDGSTDNCGKILQEYATKDKRIKIITQKNSGYGKAINAGLSVATGEYVAILESDDWAESDMYATLYRLAQKHNLDVIKADYYEFWSNGFNKTAKIGQPSDYNVIFRLEPDKYMGKIWGSIWSALYRRKFLQDNNIAVTESRGASYQDTGFIFKTNICAKSMMLLDKAFLHYRQDNAGSSVKNKEKIFALSKEYDEIESYLQKYDLTQWQNLLLRRRIEGCLWNLNRLTPENRRIYLQQKKLFMLSVLHNQNMGQFQLSGKKLRKLHLLEVSETLFLWRYRWKDFVQNVRRIFK